MLANLPPSELALDVGSTGVISVRTEDGGPDGLAALALANKANFAAVRDLASRLDHLLPQLFPGLTEAGGRSLSGLLTDPDCTAAALASLDAAYAKAHCGVTDIDERRVLQLREDTGPAPPTQPAGSTPPSLSKCKMATPVRSARYLTHQDGFLNIFLSAMMKQSMRAACKRCMARPSGFCLRRCGPRAICCARLRPCAAGSASLPRLASSRGRPLLQLWPPPPGWMTSLSTSAIRSGFLSAFWLHTHIPCSILDVGRLVLDHVVLCDTICVRPNSMPSAQTSHKHIAQIPALQNAHLAILIHTQCCIVRCWAQLFLSNEWENLAMQPSDKLKLFLSVGEKEYLATIMMRVEDLSACIFPPHDPSAGSFLQTHAAHQHRRKQACTMLGLTLAVEQRCS